MALSLSIITFPFLHRHTDVMTCHRVCFTFTKYFISILSSISSNKEWFFIHLLPFSKWSLHQFHELVRSRGQIRRNERTHHTSSSIPVAFHFHPTNVFISKYSPALTLVEGEYLQEWYEEEKIRIHNRNLTHKHAHTRARAHAHMHTTIRTQLHTTHAHKHTSTDTHTHNTHAHNHTHTTTHAHTCIQKARTRTHNTTIPVICHPRVTSPRSIHRH